MTTVTVPVPPDGGTSQRWGEWAPLRQPPPDGDAIAIDLTNVEFVDPFFLLRLRGFIDWHCSNGLAIHVEPPKSRAVRRYLERMDLAGNLPAACSCELESNPSVDIRDVLIPIRRLGSTLDATDLDYELESLLSAHFTGELAGLADAFTRTVGEMCDNATTHGRSAVGKAYVAAQRYAHGRCVLVVGDLGVGIPEHMRRLHPQLFNDDDAIREATKEGVTGTDKPHRGIGYQYVIDGLKESNIPFGELKVWSGKGRFRVEAQNGRQVRRRAWGVDGATAGTWVRLELVGE